MALEMRPDCERCGRDLPPDSSGARICSFECTFCAECVEGALAGACPNCGGDLRPRPTGAAMHLEQYPPSTQRKGPQ
jgi:hypothetical protein